MDLLCFGYEFWDNRAMRRRYTDVTVTDSLGDTWDITDVDTGFDVYDNLTDAQREEITTLAREKADMTRSYHERFFSNIRGW